MPSIIGTSTFKGINLGITGQTGPTGPIGITGSQGPAGLTYGPTGASGIYIINAVSDLISGGQPLQTYRDWETDRKSTRLNSSHRL